MLCLLSRLSDASVAGLSVSQGSKVSAPAVSGGCKGASRGGRPSHYTPQKVSRCRSRLGELFAIPAADRTEQQETEYRTIRNYLARLPARQLCLGKLREEVNILLATPPADRTASQVERLGRLQGILDNSTRPQAVRHSVDWEGDKENIVILGAIEGEQSSEEFAVRRIAHLTRPAPRDNVYHVRAGFGNQRQLTYLSMRDYIAQRPHEVGAEDNVQSITVWVAGNNPAVSGDGLHSPETQAERRTVSQAETYRQSNVRRYQAMPGAGFSTVFWGVAPLPRSPWETTQANIADTQGVERHALPRLAYRGRMTLEEAAARAVETALSAGKIKYRRALNILTGVATARAIVAGKYTPRQSTRLGGTPRNRKAYRQAIARKVFQPVRLGLPVALQPAPIVGTISTPSETRIYRNCLTYSIAVSQVEGRAVSSSWGVANEVNAPAYIGRFYSFWVSCDK